ncbi:MAG TPA: DUF488 family protein [Alphaproteobacteria bacterium]|jgi:uncharacterized protein YeaO (DUF488 family)|nr:DUF488 family protein [Alphaproteobacteria bacterium]
MIRVKRVYDPPARADGTRILIDRVWPRGLSKKAVDADEWLKDVAPSTALRRWFGHDPAKWTEFRRRYAAELAEQDAAVAHLRALARRGTVTLVFAARDAEHSNAAALKAYLERKK